MSAATDPAARAGRRPLRRVLAAPFLALMLVLVAITGWLWYLSARAAVDEVTGQLRAEISGRIGEFLSGYLAIPHRINALNEDAILLGEIRDWTPDTLGRHFLRQLEEFPEVAYIFLGTVYGGAAGAGRGDDGLLKVDSTDVDPALGLVAGTRSEYTPDVDGGIGDFLGSRAGFDARERPWFRNAEAAGEPVWSEVYSLFTDRTLAIAASQPVYDPTGALWGVLGVDLTLSGVDEYLRTQEVGRTGLAFIVDVDGALIASSSDEKPFTVGDGSSLVRLTALGSREPLIAETASFLVDRFGSFESAEPLSAEFELASGERQFVDLTPLPLGSGRDWWIAVVIPARDYTAALATGTRETALLSLVALVAAMALGVLIAWWINRPIARLIDASEAIAGGRLAERVEVHSIDELSALAGAFNRMADQLERSFEELESRVAARTDELSKAKEAADAASQAKSRFLATVSHEIRTPLAAIRGYVDLLRDRRTDETERRLYLRTVRSSADHLNHLLGDLLDLSRIEAGKLELLPTRCRLDELLGPLVSSFLPLAVEGGLELELETAARVPWSFRADPVRVRQVLSNLLSNAVKFTDEGRVRLSVGTDPAPGDDGRGPATTTLHLVVEDTGPGISEESQRQLFEPFTQLESRSRRQGFGLGLSITRQLVELMGGELKLESRLGEGTRFTVLLPVSDCADWGVRRLAELSPVGDGDDPSTWPALGGRVLIADDSEALRTLCRHMLERWSIDCSLATDGREAVEAARQRLFDAILMDWQMPFVNGLEATLELREAGIETPIVALTAAAMSGDREACLAAGCDAYLVKPIDFRELHRLLATMLPGARSAAEAPTGGDEEVEGLLRAYLASLSGRVAQLRSALEGGDWKTLEARAHRLVGTSGSYGLVGVSEAGEALESSSRRADHAAAAVALDRLESEIASAGALIR